jgi:small-conductance mechanosensitive channel
VKRLVEAGCTGVPRVLAHPRPVVHFMEMGDSALDFLVRVWIRDPVEGLQNVRSALLFAVWDTLKANDIEVPFPQQELSVKGPVTVRLDPGADAA